MTHAEVDQHVATLEKLVDGLVADRKLLLYALTQIVRRSQDYELQPRDRMVWMREHAVSAMSKLSIPQCFERKQDNG